MEVTLLREWTDQALVAAVEQGDEAAAAELVERYNRPGLLAVRRQLGGDLEAARDVVQTVWQELCPKLLAGEIQEFGRLFWWLLKRRTIDEQRRRGRGGPASLDSPAGEAPAPLAERVADGGAPGPEGELLRTEEHSWARRALDGLAARDRAVILARAVQGLSNRETAHLLVQQGLVEPGGDLEKRVENYYYRALTRYRDAVLTLERGGSRP